MIAKLLQAPYEDLQLRFAGLNHMVWVHEVLQRGKDVTADVLKMLCDGASLSMNNIKEAPWPPEFLQAMGAIPAHTIAISTKHKTCWQKRWPQQLSVVPVRNR